MKNLNIILIIVFYFLIQFSYGQNNYTVIGVVVDSLSKEKLFYANVIIAEKDSTSENISHTTTDISGKFKMKNIPKGDFILKISYVGYYLLEIPIIVSGDKKKINLGTLNLNQNRKLLGAVSVVAKKPVYAVEGEKTLYNVSEDQGIQSGTASDALQNAPGVSVDIEGNITLRGVSSVEIWVNGKPSRLKKENLKTYIQQLPANSIESIEVITNPSARYNTKGDGGVINLVLNRKIKKNRFLSFGLRQSSKPDFSTWASYAWTNKKWSVNLYLHSSMYNYDYDNNGYSTILKDNPISEENKDTSNYQSFSKNKETKSKSFYSYISVSYDLDTMNSFSFWFGGDIVRRESNSYREDFRQEYSNIINKFDYNTNESSQRKSMFHYSGFSYEHKFNNEGHKLGVDISTFGWYSDEDSDFIRKYKIKNNLDKNKLENDYSNDFSIDNSINYSIPFNEEKGEISLGLDASYGISDRKNRNDTLIIDVPETYQLDAYRYFDASFIEKNFGFYSTVKHKFDNFTAKIGIRSKNENIKSEVFNSPNDNFNKNYFGLYPSIHLSYRTESMHNFKISYTHRVGNPYAQNLTSFVRYREDSFSKGNPDLKQTYTNSFEGGWNKYFEEMGSYGIGLYYKNSLNEINTFNGASYSHVFGRYVNFTMPVNSGETHNTGGDINMSYRLQDFMRISFYSNFYYKNSKIDFSSETENLGFNINNETKEVITENLGFDIKIRYWAKLWKLLEMDCSANYQSEEKLLFLNREPEYTINLGLRADFFERKLSAYVRVRDLFNWNKRETNINSPYYISYNSMKYDSRTISAGITLRFGKMELEHKAKSGENI